MIYTLLICAKTFWPIYKDTVQITSIIIPPGIKSHIVGISLMFALFVNFWPLGVTKTQHKCKEYVKKSIETANTDVDFYHLFGKIAQIISVLEAHFSVQPSIYHYFQALLAQLQ